MGKRSHDGEHDLALGIHGVDVLLLEENGYALFLKLPDVFQAVQGISGKPADRFCNDHVDAARHALIDHSVEFFTLLGVGAGDAIICINSCQCPVRVAVDVSCVMFDLRIVAGSLLVTVG